MHSFSEQPNDLPLTMIPGKAHRAEQEQSQDINST